MVQLASLNTIKTDTDWQLVTKIHLTVLITSGGTSC